MNLNATLKKLLMACSAKGNPLMYDTKQLRNKEGNYYTVHIISDYEPAMKRDGTEYDKKVELYSSGSQAKVLKWLASYYHGLAGGSR